MSNLDKVVKFAQAYDDLVKRKAVCVLIERDGKVLAVARRGTTDQWGLPGGKVDPGEEPREALIREMREETGISLDPDALHKVFHREDGEFDVDTFQYEGPIRDLPKQGDAGPVTWVTWDELLEGPFGQYNAQLKQVVKS
jgi:8-oxo-dGTP pyrophosphatase MutT (NUDIX family)